MDNSTICSDILTSFKEYQSSKLARIKADKTNRWISAEPYKPKYKNYVLVIGESERKDYMSLYGYPLKTTPFLDETKGTFIENYYSTAAYTEKSLINSLYFQDNQKMKETAEVFFIGNIIQLAKKANLKTYWLSNNNTGKNSQLTSLMKQSDYVFKRYHLMFDDELLIKLNELLNVNKELKDEQTNLFILHLIGQHEPYCKRLRNKTNKLFKIKGTDIGCYLQSIYENDQLLKEITKTLNNYGSWSLMYFSDHGLIHSHDGTFLRHAGNSDNLSDTRKDFKSSYEVPMLKISSDDKERKVIKTQKTGFNFIYGFTEWLGIKEKHLAPNYCFWCDKADENIRVFGVEKEVSIAELADGPAKLPK